jgi:hypothetical protein
MHLRWYRYQELLNMNFVLIAIQALLMNWFISKIVFRISTEKSACAQQFDEQIRLISAGSREEAFMKARTIGLNEEDCFFDKQSKQVKWEFVNVSEIIPLSSLTDGAELYSKIIEVQNAKEYMRCIHEKAIFIRKNFDRILTVSDVAH